MTIYLWMLESNGCLIVEMHNMPSYESLRGRKLDLSHLKVFGIIVYVHASGKVH